MLDSDIDIAGYQVVARDGPIGKVDEVAQQADESYIVVDTGPWIFGKKTAFPGRSIERIDADEQTIYVLYTKDEIKNAPEYDPWSSELGQRQDLEAYYGRLPGGPKVRPKPKP